MDYILTPQDDPPIKPEHINSRQHFWSAFGNNETEISARWIVHFCQQRNEGWQPIPEEKLVNFYRAERKQEQADFLFNRLPTEKWIKIENGVITLSKQFVARCYESSPL